jgi:hypothetical protein
MVNDLRGSRAARQRVVEVPSPNALELRGALGVPSLYPRSQ